MKICIRHKSIIITGAGARMAADSPLFRGWLSTLDQTLMVHAVEIQSVDMVVRQGKREILFIKLKADITDEYGRPMPGIVFLRGPSVGILIVMETRKNAYAVLIESSLAATGLVSYPQLPAGMADRQEDLLAVALREMKEETGIDPKKGKMLDLTEAFFAGKWKGIYPSPGACDEYIRLFLYRQRVSEDSIRKLHGRIAGLAHEREHLTLKLVKLGELCSMTADVKAHSAHMMYTTLKQRGML